jgi:integrase
MGQETTNHKKGEISINNADGRIRLRWRINAVRYSLNLPYQYTDDNLHFARITAAEIRLDIMKGSFDASLDKYKVNNSPSIQNLTAAKLPTKEDSQYCIYLRELIPLFTEWATNIRSIDLENTSYYYNAQKLLAKWENLEITDLPAKLNSQKFAPTTYNDRLTCLRNFLTWLYKKSKIASNPLEEVCRKKKRKKISDKRRPLTEDEILLFLDAIMNNTHCPTASQYKHSFYHSFFYFIFLTGVRNAEAIGLRVKHINFNLNNIEISETFARTRKGSNHAARIRKGTKMENIRYLPLTDILREVLIPQLQGKQPDDFVFLSPTGLSIDDQTLQRRVFKPVMKAIGLGDKDLYAARHCYGTRSIEQGISANSTAYAMGHATADTTIRNYVDVVRPSTELPHIHMKKV